MNEQMATILRDLGLKLGVSAEYLWGVLVAGQRIEGGVMTVLGVVGIAVCILSMRAAWKNSDEWDELIVISVGVIGTIGMPCGLIMSGYGLIMLLAPEYSALKMILGAIQ